MLAGTNSLALQLQWSLQMYKGGQVSSWSDLSHRPPLPRKSSTDHGDLVSILARQLLLHFLLDPFASSKILSLLT